MSVVLFHTIHIIDGIIDMNELILDENYISDYEDPVAEDPVAEDQEVISILKNIDEKIGDLNVRDSKQNEVDDSIDSNDGVLLRSSEVVSSNIINKPINDYDVSESLLLMIWLSLAVAGIVVMIKRSIFKWT